MINLFIFCLKSLYWILIGWWLKPIQHFKSRKIKKMQNEIIKENYKQLKEKKED